MVSLKKNSTTENAADSFTSLLTGGHDHNTLSIELNKLLEDLDEYSRQQVSDLLYLLQLVDDGDRKLSDEAAYIAGHAQAIRDSGIFRDGQYTSQRNMLDTLISNAQKAEDGELP